MEKIPKGYAGGIAKPSTSQDDAPSRISEENLMKRKLFITLAIVGTLCFAGQFFTTAAHPGAQDKNAFTPDTIQWGPPPPFIAPGAQVAVIEGNPGAPTGDLSLIHI